MQFGGEIRQDAMAGPSPENPAHDDDSFGDGHRPARPEAEYIASMLDGLRQLAVGAQLPFLAYLIGVALEEAKSEKNGLS